MKSEVAFFKDKRANTAEHIIRCYRFFGFTDKEIINEMKKIIALRKDNLKVGSEYDQTLELLEPSPSDVSMTQDVLMTIKTSPDNTSVEHEGNFIVCQKCRTVLPPQIDRYQWGCCPACGRAIKKGE